MDDVLWIRGGRVIDPSQGLDRVGDVLVRGGVVEAVGEVGRRPRGARVIDAGGLIVCPGLIDMHVHLREPGAEEKETIATGTAAAAAGGMTAVACMPNTTPALDTAAAVDFVYRQSRRAGRCRVWVVGAITRGREGRELAEMGQMRRAGAVAFSDDGRGVASAAVMLRALQYVSMFDRPIIQHCEDPELSAGGCMHAGATASRLGLGGIPSLAEEVMLGRDLRLLEAVGGKYHVAHISTRGSVEMVRQAKRRGLSVTAEVCPHHLLLTDEACREFDTRYKVNPPLRSAGDVAACVAGVVDGTIDCLVSDHAPHTAAEKERDFVSAPFGIAGVETSLALFAQVLVHSGRMGWGELIRCMSTNPARVLGVPGGSLRPGSVADITLIDPEMEWTIDPEAFRSRSRNTPFGGWRVKGRAVGTIVGGRVMYSLLEGVEEDAEAVAGDGVPVAE